MTEPLSNSIDFWKVKHQIDDQAVRLGWGQQKCASVIINRYGKISRLVMTDEQLLDLLDYMKQQHPSRTAIGRQTKDRKARKRKRK